MLQNETFHITFLINITVAFETFVRCEILEGDVIMTDFISEHKKFTIGIILYIALFFTSMYFSPWQLSNVEETAFLDNILFKIVFCGIYELLELMVYSMEGFSGGSVMFFFSACAIFSYIMIIKKIALNIIDDGIAFDFDFDLDLDFDFDIEDIIFNYICDNVLIYIACLISFYIYTPAAGWVNTEFTGGNFGVKALMVIFVIFIVIIPSLPHFISFIAYLLGTYGIINLIGYMDRTLSWNSIVKNIIFFIIAALMIIIINIVFDKLIDFLLGKIIEFLTETVASIAMFCVGIIVLLIVIIVLVLVFT